MASIFKRGDAYYVQIRRRGYPPQRQSFQRLTDAKAWATRIEADMDARRAVPSRKAAQRTVSDLFAKYRLEILPRYSRRERGQRGGKLDWWEKRLGYYRLTELTPADINDALSTLKTEGRKEKAVGPATLTRYLATLKHVLTVAVRDWQWIDDSPAGKVRAPREPRGRLRYLTPDEKKKLLEACQPDVQLYALVLTALTTGARQGELLRLCWADLDLAKGKAIIQQSKNGERRTLSITGPAVAALRALPRRVHRDEVFIGSRGGASFPQEAWRKAVDKAVLGDFRFHDLRHTAASHLAMSGATLSELAAFLGHKTFAMVKRYSHLTEEHTSGKVKKMVEEFLG